MHARWNTAIFMFQEIKRTMDVKTVFRKLLTNQYMKYFDYSSTSFSFKTVFHELSHRYCCCSCAFEHEYMDYISVSGDIDEAMFEQVVDNIVKGRCPHVDEVPVDYVRETSIYAIHIAAAVGTEKAIKNHLVNYSVRLGNIFGVEPCMIALMKQGSKTVRLYYEKLSKENIREDVCGCVCEWSAFRRFQGTELLHGTRSLENKKKICMERISVPELCVRRRSKGLLETVLKQNVLHTETGVARALELTFKYRLVGMQKLLLKYVSHTCISKKGCTGLLVDYVLLAIVYDQPTVFNQIMSLFMEGYLSKDVINVLAEICFVLQRKQCQDVLYKDKSFSEKNNCDHDTMLRKIVLTFLDRFYNDYKYDIIHSLPRIPTIHGLINLDGKILNRHNVSLLHMYLKSRNVNKHVVQAMLDLGADVDSRKTNGYTPMERLIDNEIYQAIPGFREAIELLIFENANTELNENAVEMGIEVDKRYGNIPAINGDYLMDAITHCAFEPDSQMYALNFITPLLIECGYRTQRGTLLCAMDMDLHPKELAYIQQCLEEPRQLQLCCRDVLRKHYKGRRIHQFVAASKIPVKIGDYILMKPVLRHIQPKCL